MRTTGQPFSPLLRGCAGFRVESADGYHGFVEEVLYGSDSATPEALIVRSGLFHKRLELVPVESIERIDAGERRVVVRTASPFVTVGEY